MEWPQNKLTALVFCNEEMCHPALLRITSSLNTGRRENIIWKKLETDFVISSFSSRVSVSNGAK